MNFDSLALASSLSIVLSLCFPCIKRISNAKHSMYVYVSLYDFYGDQHLLVDASSEGTVVLMFCQHPYHFVDELNCIIVC